MDYSSSRRLSRVALPVHHIVKVVLEGRDPKVEVHRIQGHQFRDEFGLDLRFHIVDRVAIDKAASLGHVSMEVNIHLKLGSCMLLENSLLRRVNGRMLLHGRELVLPVQIAAVCIETPVSSSHAIWIEARNNLEDVVLEQ